MLREASGTVKDGGLGRRILRAIHGRDARATFAEVVFPAIVSAEGFSPQYQYAFKSYTLSPGIYPNRSAGLDPAARAMFF
jgi:hypothetical protein